MNKPRMAATIETPPEFLSGGEFSFDHIEDMLNEADSGDAAGSESLKPQYQVVMKRNDGLYKTLHILNTIVSIIGVLLIAAIFGMVFYGLVTITEVAEIVSQTKEHNILPPSSP